MTTNSDLGGSDLNANLTATTKPYITGCNDKYKTVTVVNTLASLMLKYQAELGQYRTEKSARYRQV